MLIAGLCFYFFVSGIVSAENRTNAILTVARNSVETPCRTNNLLVYKVILTTFWSRTSFPKHYPDWRPSAQWSKVLGFAHDNSFHLFRLGQRSSPGVKTFAETGRSDIVDLQNQQIQGNGGIFDEFHASPIRQGEGQSEVQFYVDGNHSMVSLMSRIIPSPDWFIGVDSFNLCKDGKWLDSATIEVDPIDAGTDNGFTFTAPNWATDPQSEAYRITSQYPAHPASSFYYPRLKKLPSIAKFQFLKMKEYKLTHQFNYVKKVQTYDSKEELEHIQSNTINIFNNLEDIVLGINKKRRKQGSLKEEFENFKDPSKGHGNIDAAPSRKNSMNQTMILDSHPFSSNVITLDEREALMNGIANNYLIPQRREKHSYMKNRKRRKNIKKHHPPKDCRVSEWSAWSNCSKTCGIGEMTRRRHIIKHSRHGGRICPPLQETKWCGSARSCDKQYFEW